MESVETLIPDNEGNHLVVVLNFYEDNQKIHFKYPLNLQNWKSRTLQLKNCILTNR